MTLGAPGEFRIAATPGNEGIPDSNVIKRSCLSVYLAAGL